MNHLETVQRKAARFVCNNYYGYSGVYIIYCNSYSDKLWNVGGLRPELIMTYKITYNLVHTDQRYLSKKHTQTFTPSLPPMTCTRINASTYACSHSFYPLLIRI